MAEFPPTLADFRARFPEFANAGDPQVSAILSEASAEIGADWLEKDKATAALYLAAHMLAGSGGLGGPGASGVAVSGPVRSRSVGDVSVTFAGVEGSGYGSKSIYASTGYGQRFLQLARRNFPAVAIV